MDKTMLVTINFTIKLKLRFHLLKWDRKRLYLPQLFGNKLNLNSKRVPMADILPPNHTHPPIYRRKKVDNKDCLVCIIVSLYLCH